MHVLRIKINSYATMLLHRLVLLYSDGNKASSLKANVNMRNTIIIIIIIDSVSSRRRRQTKQWFRSHDSIKIKLDWDKNCKVKDVTAYIYK